MNTLNDVLAVILGGGVGKRLYPLTKERAKPAVPIAGKYRLIDIPLSNCINSNIHRIAILTQFNSVSLHRHITQTYNFDSFHSGWVQIWAAEQTPTSNEWYQGTADAVRKQLFEIASADVKYVLILAGDHLYRMDYESMAEFHWATGAEITVAVQPVSRGNTSRFGILKRDINGRIIDFAEKPKTPELLSNLVSRNDPARPYLGSMGIYMFNTRVLFEFLESTPFTDFGGEVIPNAVKTHKVFGFDFDGYWEDIGTIRSFYDTNLSLTQPESPFNLFDANSPIYTRPRFLPGSILDGSTLHNVLLTDGSRIGRANIQDSVIGLRSVVSSGTEIRSTIVMGNDFYETEETNTSSEIPLGIGPNCFIEGAILDKNVRIGNGVVIKPFPRGTEIDSENWVVRDGIVVIPKRTTIPDGMYIGPE
jgi:glucose-1-phosphate adenylyltransferase